MRRALRGAAGALVAAGALGLVRPSAAQQTPYLLSGPKFVTSGPIVTGPIHVGPAEHVAVVSPAHRKLEEMKVELAWHADLATFSYELDARIVGDHVEVRGYVPNEAIKAKALATARKYTVFPVVDKLKLMPTLAARSVGRPAEEVKEEASQLLAEKLGGEAKSFEIKSTGIGEVTIGGTVQSVEDKLAASHLLRQVRGCGCVVNQLTVAPVLRDGRMTTAVSRDGKETISGAMPDLNAVVESEGFPVGGHPIVVTSPPMGDGHPVVVTPPPMGHMPLAKPVSRPLPGKPAQQKTPFTLDSVPAPVVVPPKRETELPSPRLVPPAPAKPAGLPSILPSTRRPPAKDTTTVTRKELVSDPLAAPDLLSSSSKPAQPAVLPPALPSPKAQPVKDTLPVTKKDAVLNPPAALPSTPLSTKAQPAKETLPVTKKDAVPNPLAALPSNTPSPKAQPAKDILPVTKKDAVPNPLAAPELPANWSKKPPVGVTKGSDFATEGRNTEGKVVPAASRSEPKTDKPMTDKPKSDKPADYYETTGMVLFEDEPRAAVPANQALPMSPAVLKQRVEGVCGKQAKSVQVITGPDGSLRVKVTLVDPLQERILTQRLLAMPEMSSPRVHLETSR